MNKLFDGDVVCEKTFPWLKTPSEITDEYRNLCHNLALINDSIDFAKKNVSLRCDFVCESKKLIIEYDECQHFTQERRISLQNYTQIPIDFDRDFWIKACEDIQAKDNQHPNRDTVRAYYDSVRDIEAYKNGYRLVRIMHGQIDFTDNQAIHEVKKLLELSEKTNHRNGLKIALYLQTEGYKNEKDFNKAMDEVKNSDADILVFPENCYIPSINRLNYFDIRNPDDEDLITDICYGLSYYLGKAVIVSSEDAQGMIFSVFANANANTLANEPETDVKIYLKHTQTDFSPLDLDEYQNIAEELFEPIFFKGYHIGMTICYDCNHSIFSRIYGLQNVDIIINSTGGNIKDDKWFKYNKVRAIENNCYTFVTMGGIESDNNSKCRVYGFNPNGKDLLPENYKLDGTDTAGKIYFYDISRDNGTSEEDRFFNQRKGSKEYEDLVIPVKNVSETLKDAEKIDESIYIMQTENKHTKKYQIQNIVFFLVDGMDIMKPEIVLPLLYSDKIKSYKNKRYIIVNRHNQINDDFYRTKLSVTLKVRSMENFCAVILTSDKYNECYQCGHNRSSQVIVPVKGLFHIDLSRTGGPDTIWKNKAIWRENIAWLINGVQKFSP